MMKDIIKKVMKIQLMDSLNVIKIQKDIILILIVIILVIQHVNFVKKLEIKLIINALNVKKDMN